MPGGFKRDFLAGQERLIGGAPVKGGRDGNPEGGDWSVRKTGEEFSSF